MLVTELGCDSLRTLELTVLSDIETACTTSTHNPDVEHLTIYPVPTQDVLHIVYTGNKQLENYFLLGLKGQAILKEKAESNFSLQLGELPEGIYLLQLQLGDGTMMSRKVSVIR